MKQLTLENSQCMVIKIGSALLVNEADYCFREVWLESFLEDVAVLRKKGVKIVLVSSGAIATGKLSLNIRTKQISLDTKQAIAAVGQVELMHRYQISLEKKSIKSAQVLLTLEDTEDRRRFINLRNTLNKLLQMDIIPIINENDSVATAEIKYGDNDRLAARVAEMLGADTLILLSDIDGLYTDDPRVNPQAGFIPIVEKIDETIMSLAKDTRSKVGTGGMISKLEAAIIAINSGCRMLITAGKYNNPLTQFTNTQRGTWFLPTTTPQTAKKVWLQQHLKSKGKVLVDAGAVLALEKGASLLAVGMREIYGDFEKGEAVDVIDADQQLIARGLVNFTSRELDKIKGHSTDKISAILGYDIVDEVIHRDNLVLMREKS